MPAQTRDGFPVRMGPKVMPGGPDTYVAYGRGWANVGEHAVPRVQALGPRGRHQHAAHRPLAEGHRREGRTAQAARPPHRHRRDVRRPGRGEVPREVGDAITPLEGKSLVPAFAGKPLDRDAIFWEHEGNRAVRAGDWKLVAKHGRSRGNCTTSRRTASNRTTSPRSMPDKVKELTAKYDAWAKRAHVEPWPVGAPKKKE